MMAPGYEEGFGFLRGVALDQHLLTRHRENDLPAVLKKHPDLLGIGLDEDTAIVVQGDEFQVMGKSKIAIYNPAPGTGTNGVSHYFLQAGDRFNLATRQKGN
jgi:cyanophycinase